MIPVVLSSGEISFLDVTQLGFNSFSKHNFRSYRIQSQTLNSKYRDFLFHLNEMTLVIVQIKTPFKYLKIL